MFRHTGLVFGLALLVLFALIADSTLLLLHKCSQFLLMTKDETYSRYRNYEDIGQNLHGQLGATFVKVCVILINFGAQVLLLPILEIYLRN